MTAAPTKQDAYNDMNNAELQERRAKLEESSLATKGLRKNPGLIVIACLAVGAIVTGAGLIGMVVLGAIALLSATSAAVAQHAVSHIGRIDAVLAKREKKSAAEKLAQILKNNPPPAPPPAPDLSSEFRNGTKKSLAVRTLQLVGGRRTSEQSPKG